MTAGRGAVPWSRRWRRSAALARDRFVARYSGRDQRPLDAIGRGADHRTACPPLVQLHEAYGSLGSNPEVLVFGDSTSVLVSPYDLSRRDLGVLIADALQPMDTCVVAALAYHSDVYASLLRAVEVMPGRPRVIVMPVNVRQFGPEWTLNPNTQFEDVIAAARAFADDPKRPIELVQPFPHGNILRSHPDPDKWQRFVETPVAYPGRTERTIGDFVASINAPDDVHDEAWFRTIWAFHFLFPVEPANPRFRSLADAVGTAARMGVPIVVYLSPANHTAGRALLGEAFDDSLRAKVEAARSVVLDAGKNAAVSFQDWTTLLPASDFFIEREVLSHLNEFGRRRLVERLVPLVQAREWRR